MTVRLVIGRAGSGKTRHCLDEVIKRLREAPAGPALLVLVPEQAAFQTERALLESLSGFGRAHVVSFRRLARMAMGEPGSQGEDRPVLPAAADELVVRDLLRRLDLPSLGAASAASASAICRALGELDGACADSDRLLGAIRDLEDSDDSADTAARLRDLHRLQVERRRAIDGRFLSPGSEMNLLARRCADWPLLSGARLWVDGFLGFTGQEFAVLAALLGAVEHAEIALTVDPRRADADKAEPGDPFAPMQRTLRRIRRLARDAGATELPALRLGDRPPRRFASSPAIAHLERNLFDDDPTPHRGEPAELTVAVADDPRAEVEAAAVEILRLARDRGMRFREIGVVLRDPGVYVDLCAEVFGRRGIPHFADRRRSLRLHPLVRMLGNVLAIVGSEDRGTESVARAILSALRNELSPLSRADTDRLEVAVIERGIRPEQWWSHEPWPEDRVSSDQHRTGGVPPVAQTASGEPTLPGSVAEHNSIGDPIDALRRRAGDPLMRCVESCRGATIRGVLTALWTLLEDWGVPQRLELRAAEAAGDPALADEHRQAARQVCKLFDDVASAVGDQVWSAVDFAEAFAGVLGSLSLAQAPPTLDGVIVGDVERSRFPELRAALVLGLSEGTFPKAVDEDPILDDADRACLDRLQIKLAPASRRRLFEENTFAYVALTRAGRRLWISRPRRDIEGKPANPSRLLLRLAGVFPDLQPVETGTAGSPAGSVNSIDDAALELAAAGRGEAVAGDGAALLPGVASTGPDPRRAVEIATALTELGRSVPAAPAPASERLDEELRRRLWPDPVRAEASRLESMARCAFHHFATYGLDISARRTPAVDVLAAARLEMSALERFVRRLTLLSEPPAPGALRPLMDDAIREVSADVLPKKTTASERFRIARVNRNLGDSAERIGRLLGRERLAPVLAGLRYGSSGAALPAWSVDVEGDRRIEVTGRVARVDAAELTPDEAAIAGASVAFAVREFRRRDTSASLERMFHGLSLRSAVHLLVLMRHGEAVFGAAAAPAAALLLPSAGENWPIVWPDPRRRDSEQDPSVKQRGVLVEELLDLLDPTPGPHASADYRFQRGNDSRIIRREVGDVLTAAELQALLGRVRTHMQSLAQRLLDGEISVRPYRLGAETPCDQCESRPVCRLDAEVHGHRNLEPLAGARLRRRLAEV